MTKAKNFKNLLGMRFDKLTVIKRTKNNKCGQAMWICKCDCGGETIASSGHLLDGHTTSCGCNKLSKIANGHSRERIYRIWNGMKKRCYYKNNDNYKYYGEIGITICDEWKNSFMKFRQWALNNGYKNNLTIDRIDFDKGYEPNNCRFVNMTIQQNNKRSNRIVIHNNKKYTVAELARKLGIKYYTIHNRLSLGWSIERIVNTPEQCHE